MQYDLSRFSRSSVGFEHLFSLLDQYSGLEMVAQSYPPYNIERHGENEYRISIAVAGFAEKDLLIETHDNTLSVRGAKEHHAGTKDQKFEMLHQGIAGRSFERRFQLAEYVSVLSARLEHGLLHIDLIRELPEVKRPRRVTIETNDALSSPLDPETNPWKTLQGNGANQNMTPSHVASQEMTSSAAATAARPSASA